MCLKTENCYLKMEDVDKWEEKEYGKNGKWRELMFFIYLIRTINGLDH